jgi:hypothetical protein
MGKKGQRQFTFRLFSLIAGINTNKLLIIVLGLIANLMLVSGDCNVGTQKMKNFNWYEVGIIVLT